MSTQLDVAYNVHTRFTGTAPEGVVPQPRPADVEVLTEVPTQRGLTSTPDAILALWEEYKASGAPEARERLILHFAPLVNAVAGARP